MTKLTLLFLANMVRIRLAILVIAALAALLLAGCGDGEDAGGSSSSSALSNLASPGSVVFVEGQLQPKGELKSNLDSVAKQLTGEASLKDFVISELESSGRATGKSPDYAKEIEPWLGDHGAAAFERIVDGELSEPLIAVETTNAREAQAFVDKRAAESEDPAKDVSYKGVDFVVGGNEDDAVGLIGEALVLADGEKEFKAAVDASEGESLGGEDRFQQTVELASGGSFAEVYVDIGGIVKQSKDEIDASTKAALEGAGVDPREATAVASVMPQSQRIEVEISSELGGENAPSGAAPKLLGALPAGAFAALAFSDFNEQLQERIDTLDEEGIPPNVAPGELKSTLDEAGVDLDKIIASLDEVGVFAEGDSKASLGGAMIVTAKSKEAAEAVTSVGTLLRAANVPGITALSGKASGFSIRSGELGDKPLVVVAKDDRIAVGYGLPQALAGLDAGSGPTLAGTPAFKAASASLGKTPISAFVDGPAALSLAEALVPRSSTDFWEAVPYLKKISYIGIGRGGDEDVATAKLIAGIGK